MRPLELEVTACRLVEARVEQYARSLDVSLASGRPVQHPTRYFRHSAVVPFTLPGEPDPRGLVVKFYFGPDGSSRSAAEYFNLSMLRASFDARGPLRVPLPLEHVPAMAAVVMERIDGTSLDVLIRREASWTSLAGTRGCQQRCHAAGRWLARLLDLNPARVGTPAARTFASAWVSEMEGMVARAGGAGLSPSLLGVLARSLQYPATPRGDALRFVHSDFAPYNVHASPGALYVTDFSELPIGVGTECAAFFWCWFELAKLHPLLSGTRLDGCQAAFEAGYGEAIGSFWKTWAMLRHVSYFPAVTQDSGRLSVWWGRWRLHHLEAWLWREVASL